LYYELKYHLHCVWIRVSTLVRNRFARWSSICF